MKRGYDRSKQVGDLVQKTLASLLLQSMGDSRFHLVTVTGVSLSKDFSYAKVYVSVLSDDDDKIKEIVKALNNASKSLRYNLAHAIKIRVVPELKFVYDDSTANGFRISSLIQAAENKK